MKILSYLIEGTIFVLKLPFYCLKYSLIGFLTVISLFPKYIIIGIKFIFQRNNRNKKIENKFISIIIITLSIITYLISIFILTRWFIQNERTKNFANSLQNSNITEDKITKDTPDQYKDLTSNIKVDQDKDSTEINTNYIDVNLNYYLSKNNETVGWIQVNGTNINYPIMQHNNNEFYLEHDFYKRKTNIGWIFADYRDDLNTFNNNTIIYGHNLVNRTMFGSLPFLLNKKWFDNPNNQYIKLSTKTTNSIWQIFSVYKISPTTDYLQSVFNSTESYEKFLNMLKNRSIKNFDTSLSFTDKIITLSTCDDTGTQRVAVHAKLIKIENK